jgi:hypothetical protein
MGLTKTTKEGEINPSAINAGCSLKPSGMSFNRYNTPVFYISNQFLSQIGCFKALFRHFSRMVRFKLKFRRLR